MSPTSIYEGVKSATVAIVASIPGNTPRRPYTIFGSGFCIRSEGVVVTCEHVFKAFVEPESYMRIMQAIGRNESKAVPVRSIVPHAMFFGGVHEGNVRMIGVPIATGVAMVDFDLAVLKLQPSPAFRNGYPILLVEVYSEVHEMMEVATCGFPLGESLGDQFGTVTSSFTRGMISSIIPAPGIPIEHLKGFQLDLTATNGNSGGPVFSVETGRVLGVLQSGALHPETKNVIQGITRAEPIYPIFDTDVVDRLARDLPVPRPR